MNDLLLTIYFIFKRYENIYDSLPVKGMKYNLLSINCWHLYDIW